MNDEFPLIIIEHCQTYSILMLSSTAALRPEPSPESLQRGLYVCAGGLDTVKIDKSQLICSVSYFDSGAWSIVLGDLDHQAAPAATEWFRHVPLFMDRICLLVVPVDTEVDLQILQTNKVCSDSTRNEQEKCLSY